jgi:hypothetical protein
MGLRKIVSGGIEKFLFPFKTIIATLQTFTKAYKRTGKISQAFSETLLMISIAVAVELFKD